MAHGERRICSIIFAGYRKVVDAILAKLNPRERDSFILFEPDEHKYTILDSSDSPVNVASVTTLLSSFFPEFDADTVIEKYYPRWTADDFSRKPELKGLCKEEP